MKRQITYSIINVVTIHKHFLKSCLLIKELKFFSLLILVLFFSCTKVLDREPETQVSEEKAITNKKGAQAAIAGLYNELQSGEYYGRNFQIMGDVSSDIAQSIGSWDHYREMDLYQVSLGNTENGNFYARAYRAINMANNILFYVPQLADINATDKNTFSGQAYFIRALAYFDLTRVYGGVPGIIGTLGVPIVTQPSKQVDEKSFPERASLEASYKQVENDLLKAVELLPETYGTDATNRSQAVKGAAKALLSRLYLYLTQPTEVIQYSNQVINDAKYVLSINFANIFENKLTQEAIFELNFTSSDQSGIRNWYFPSGLGGRADIAVHESFYKEATANAKDSRGKLLAFNAGAGTYYPTKYQKAGNIDNAHIIRLAEIYLNRAEAKALLNDVTGALTDLNVIRNRAGLENVSLSSSTEVLQAIWKERKLELAFEGHRFFDLVRTGQAVSVLKGVDRKNGPPVSIPAAGRQVFPIPSFEVDANKKILQNEAYR